MVTMTIDGLTVQVPEGTTILEAAKTAHIRIPHLCYLKGINEIAACRVCCVEVEGERAMVTACNNPVKEGMVVHTNSPRARTTRRTNVELILSQHDCKCATCVRSGNCQLQAIANDLGILSLPYESQLPRGLRGAWTTTFPLYHDYNKCIKCMRCIQICDKVQDLRVWDVQKTGSRTTVNVSFNRSIEEAECSLCGQCITHCPVNALHVREDSERAIDAFSDPDRITIVQIAPAVRAAWGESLGLPRETATVGKLGDALRRMGADYVFDTDLGADLTVIEEASEFLERMRAGARLPMFTSCCPGWVRFLKSQYPDMVSQLSTSKSPHQMFGTLTKTWLAQRLGVDPSRIFNISIMPCVAKKQEIDIPAMNDSGFRDVDLVLTTREVVRMIRSEHIDVSVLQDLPLDDPLGEASGAAVIFGASGGVMEAALRTAYYLVNGKAPDPDAYQQMRGMDAWKAFHFDLGKTSVRCAKVSGLGNTRKLIEAMRRGEAEFDFVEVMACPGGCSGGGGQPIHEGEELAEERASVLYQLDRKAPLRFSHENPAIRKLYEDFLGKPLSAKAEALLHTDHESWQMPGRKS